MSAVAHAPRSLREALGRHRDNDDVFLVYEDERWTFRTVMEHVDALAAQLVDDYGITTGDRVAICMRNDPEWVLSFAAIVSIGAISVSLDAWWTEDEMDDALEDSGARVLIAARERVERSRAACARLGIRTIGVRDAPGPGRRSMGAAARVRDAGRRRRPRRRRDDPLQERHDRPSEGRGQHAPRCRAVADGVRVPERRGGAAQRPHPSSS
jgi:long-chain acyl-CoA synthetase